MEKCFEARNNKGEQLYSGYQLLKRGRTVYAENLDFFLIIFRGLYMVRFQNLYTRLDVLEELYLFVCLILWFNFI